MVHKHTQECFLIRVSDSHKSGKSKMVGDFFKFIPGRSQMSEFGEVSDGRTCENSPFSFSKFLETRTSGCGS